MTTSFPNLGVQSYCFRGWKENARVIEGIQRLGLTSVELCGVHCNFRDEAGFQGVLDEYRRAGISINSIGVETITGADDEKSIFEFARQAGARWISVDF